MIPSSWHGVTTVVAGNCGVGFAPVHPADHDRLIELMEGVEDIPGAVLHEGLAWNWQSFPEFMDALDGRPVRRRRRGAGAARRAAAARDGGAGRATRGRRPPTTSRRWRGIAREAIEAGALGFTTSRTLNHRTSKGEFTPTLTAEADELVGIAARDRRRPGKGVLQGVSDFADVDAEFAIFRRMAEESGRPVSFSLRAGPRRRVAPPARAARRARTPTASPMTRPGGAASGRPHARPGVHAAPAAHEPGRTARSPRCRSPNASPVMARPELQGAGARRRRGAARRRQAGRPGHPRVRPDVRARRSARLRARRGRRASRPGPQREGRDAARPRVRPAARATAAASFLYLPFLNYADGNLDAVGEMLAHPNTVVGLGDGGAHVGHDLRRELPDDAAHALGARPRSRPARPAVRGAAPDERDRAHRRSARPRRARAGLPRRRERDRLRAPRAPGARRCGTTCPRAASGSCRRPTVTSRRWSPARSPTRTARRRGPLPGRLVRGPQAAPDQRTPNGAPPMNATRSSTPLEPGCASGAATTSATRYVFQLTDAHLDELDAALAHAEATLRRRARHHPRRRSRCRRSAPSSTGITRELIDGRGRGAHPRRARRPLRQGAGVVDLLGHRDAPRPARGRRTRRAICSATSPTRARPPNDPTSRGNEIGGIAFPFHSDGSDLVGLFCLDAGAQRRREPSSPTW